jgi:transposase-like protein
MAKRDIKEKVLQLRAEGKSYSQIREVITVSKSTLSVWLKNKPLTPSQLEMLQGKKKLLE